MAEEALPHRFTQGLASELLLTPVRGGNGYESTVERLVQTVRLGLVAPGDQLPPERELASRLGVSRDTVRDAISSLTEAGFLVVRRGRYGGTFVAEDLPSGPLSLGRPAGASPGALSSSELEDALILREILESGAARSAAERTLNAPERELLWTSLDESRRADNESHRRLDSRLHLTIAELSGSPSLVAQVANCRMRINEFLERIPLLQPNILHSNEQHAEIVTAILSGRAADAEAAMRAHVQGSAALLRGFLS
jgi:DNA-binding FadR family transcriptional regulator